MTNQICKDCGKKHNYTGKNKKTWTCPDCRHVNKLIVALVAMVVMMASFGISYAEQQATVILPLEKPFAFHECISFGIEPLNATAPATSRFLCLWDWTVDPRIIEEVNHIIDDPEATPEEKAKAIEELVTSNPFVPKEEGMGIGDDIETEFGSKPPELTPDEVIVVEKLAECLRGFDRSHEWGAFVDTQTIPHWFNATRENFPERDNLNQEQYKGTQLLPVLKAIEECRGIQRYVDLNMIGEREALMAVHDRFNIGKDGLVVPTIRANEGLPKHESDSTRNIEPLRLEAERAVEFTCSDVNIARKLCYPYHDFTGINRGITEPIISHDVEVNSPLSPNRGKTAMNIYADYQAKKAADIATEQDKINYRKEINQIVCDTYFQNYKHMLGTDDFPAWLNNACLGGTLSTHYDLLQRHATND